ncbi:MAG TPA: ATP-binding cassette domain-containing protein, partial [Caldilineaceae bacterium]|nr:ATP-binding cassette domain-containing protein [Caldilineaceae bacterium]
QGGRRRRDRALEMLTLVGLGERADHRPNELSGGQQQRVAIARALANHPAMILADEPTGNLDSKTSVEIMELFQRLNREQEITIVFVTHDPETAAYCERVIHVRDGLVEKDERRAAHVAHPASSVQQTTSSQATNAPAIVTVDDWAK